MEITTDSKITVRFYRNSAAMVLNPIGAAYLKLPKGIQILEHDNFKKIIIKACEIDEPEAFPIVGKNYSYSHGGIAIKSTTFVFKIWEENKWDRDIHYIVNGIVDIKQPNLILFDLTKAERAEEKQNKENKNEQ
jgi:hypothetical protein